MRVWRWLAAALVAGLLVACAPRAASAGEYYDILRHDVHIVVAEDNVARVTETLVLHYNYPGHGFYFGVQYKGVGYYFMDGEWKEAPYLQRIDDFSVQGTGFELSRQSYDDGSRWLDAKVGDADIMVTGEQTYVITYTVDMGDNGQPQFDEFYRNLFYWEPGYDTAEASFTIELPKDVDAGLVNVTMGDFGGTDTAGVAYAAEGSTIFGRITRPLEGGQYVTIRAEFPDDYFVGERDPYAAWNLSAYAVCGIAVIAAFVLWLALGRDKRFYPTVEFYPPDGMTPAEAGYVIDGEVDDRDAVSLLLYWADKGYLKITEHAKDDFELVKLRDLEGGRSYEQHMFAQLFKNRDSVSVHALKATFYEAMAQAKNGVRLWFESNKARRVFTSASKKARDFMRLLVMLPVAYVLFMYGFRDSGDFFSAVVIAMVFGALLRLPVQLLADTFEKWRSTPPAKRGMKLFGFALMFLALFAVYAFAVPAVYSSASDFASLAITLTSVAATLLMLPFVVLMRRRTEQGAKWFAQLLGFRSFIEKAEKDRIERLVEENPEYFYNVLPYAYVLGVTDVWARKFEGIAMQPPAWYSGYSSGNAFSAIWFASYMSRGMGGFSSAMNARPVSSGGYRGGGFGGGGFPGGGGFGGGGFSGGGFGGSGGRGGW